MGLSLRGGAVRVRKSFGCGQLDRRTTKMVNSRTPMWGNWKEIHVFKGSLNDSFTLFRWHLLEHSQQTEQRLPLSPLPSKLRNITYDPESVNGNQFYSIRFWSVPRSSRIRSSCSTAFTWISWGTSLDSANYTFEHKESWWWWSVKESSITSSPYGAVPIPQGSSPHKDT